MDRPSASASCSRSPVLEEADERAGRVVLIRSGRVVADGTPAQVKAAAGAGRMVRFTLLRGSPEPFRQAPGVVRLDLTGDRLTLHTRDADATVWGLYDHRQAIADLQIADASLEDAFLSLTVENPSPDPAPH